MRLLFKYDRSILYNSLRVPKRKSNARRRLICRLYSILRVAASLKPSLSAAGFLYFMRLVRPVSLKAAAAVFLLIN